MSERNGAIGIQSIPGGPVAEEDQDNIAPEASGCASAPD